LLVFSLGSSGLFLLDLVIYTLTKFGSKGKMHDS
jgi:hypothetical protein